MAVTLIWQAHDHSLGPSPLLAPPQPFVSSSQPGPTVRTHSTSHCMDSGHMLCLGVDMQSDIHAGVEQAATRSCMVQGMDLQISLRWQMPRQTLSRHSRLHWAAQPHLLFHPELWHQHQHQRLYKRLQSSW